MKILLTGAGGFIGGRLAERIANHLYGELDLVCLTSQPNIRGGGYLCIRHNGYHYGVEDFKRAGVDRIDAVIHAGSHTAGSGFQNSGFLNAQSIQNTVHLLNHLPSVPRIFIYLSSLAVFGEDGGAFPYDSREWPFITEESSFEPKSLYGVQKLFCENLLAEWAENNSVALHILRPSQVIGEGRNIKTPVSIMLKKAALGKSLVLTAPPQMKRNCIHVDDCCDWIMKSLDLPRDVRAVNLVSHNNFSMLDFVNTVVKISGYKIQYEIKTPPVPRGRDMKYDDAKVRNFLGPEKVGFEEGLRREYIYYRDTCGRAEIKGDIR